VSLRVLLADAQPLARTGFRMILEAERDVQVVGEATDGLEVVELARRLRPDVVVIDLCLPGLDGVEATRRIAGPHVDHPQRVLVMGTSDCDEQAYRVLRAGASGFLLKNVSPAELIQAIRVVAAGDAVITSSVTRRLTRHFARLPEMAVKSSSVVRSLTCRELEVLELVARGMSNAEIATELVLSETTIKSHVSHLLTKLGLRDRVQAVVLAYEEGLVRPGGG
jgi:DNA-binding NarL/FixJ family response regulator